MPNMCEEAKRYPLAGRRLLNALFHEETAIRVNFLSSSAEEYILVHPVRESGDIESALTCASVRNPLQSTTLPGGGRDQVRTRFADHDTAAVEGQQPSS